MTGRLRTRFVRCFALAAVAFAFVGAIAVAANAGHVVRARAEREIRVSAAISMKEALGRCAEEFTRQTGASVKFSFGASGELAAQIKQGARVDLFISAANAQVEDLVKAGSADAATRTVVARNALVLIVPTDGRNPPASFEDLRDPQRVPKLAIGNPKYVPAGQYAMQVLKQLGADDAKRVVYANNVRQVLDYVERGEVPAGIVYKTDAMVSGEKVRVVASADPKLHEPIVYPAVIVKGAANASDAEAFLKFITSQKGQEILTNSGFAPAP